MVSRPPDETGLRWPVPAMTGNSDRSNVGADTSRTAGTVNPTDRLKPCSWVWC